jgi:signal transduction histidine kinase
MTPPAGISSRPERTDARGEGEALRPTPAIGADRLERLQRLLADGLPALAKGVLDNGRARAERLRAGAGGGDDALRVAAVSLAADVLVALAVENALGPADAERTTTAVADACATDLESARFELFLRAVTSRELVELPPVVAAGIQLRLLVELGVATEVSLWRRIAGGQVECILHVGGDRPARRMRAEAKAVLRQRGVRLLGRGSLKATSVRRYGRSHAAIVARMPTEATSQARAEGYLQEAAAALAPVLEREHLLERSGSRERALVSGSEKRLMRLGFDLHDGPVQDVLALAAEVRHLRDQAYPVLLEDQREQIFGRFDDVLLRLVELDRQLREIAHSLESKSIVSRPLGEILHRETEAFAQRAGIEVNLQLRGDPESLSSAQRVAVFRAIQEALANVREHSGATHVEITVRARRASIDVRIVDNGAGFEVGRALARAAQRGRLGVVGIGERVRMLGGTFEIESTPGGPTVLSLSLPRWQPLGPLPG